MPKIAFYTIFGSVFVGSLGCKNQNETLIAQKVRENVSKFSNNRAAECRADLLEEAEKIVDSLLLENARMDLQDSLALKIPFKPAKPAPIPPIDSAEVRPLFEAPH